MFKRNCLAVLSFFFILYLPEIGTAETEKTNEESLLGIAGENLPGSEKEREAGYDQKISEFLLYALDICEIIYPLG